MSRFKVISYLNTQPQQERGNNLAGLVLDISNDPNRNVTILKTGFGHNTYHPWIALDLGYNDTIFTPSAPLEGMDRLFVGTRRFFDRNRPGFDLFTEVFNDNPDKEIPAQSREQLDNIGRALAIVTLRLSDINSDGTYAFDLSLEELPEVDQSITKWLRD